MRPITKKINHFHLLAVVLITVFTICFSGCAEKKTMQPSSADLENEELRASNERLAARLEEKERLIANLQLRLLEEHSEIDRLTRMNEHLITEFVRNKSTTRNRGDKAETVRLIAEADTIITTISADSSVKGHRDALKRAEKYLTDSKSELEEGNIDGSFYLVNQALQQVQQIQLLTGATSQNKGSTFIRFSVLLPMKLLKTSNVRAGPSLQDKVQFVLGAGEGVRALGYQGQWVNVAVEGRGRGWIHYSLLN